MGDETLFPHNNIKNTIICTYNSKADQDSLHLHKAWRQPDWEQSSDVMQLEIEQQKIITSSVLVM
jgi:hypothetical protein